MTQAPAATPPSPTELPIAGRVPLDQLRAHVGIKSLADLDAFIEQKGLEDRLIASAAIEVMENGWPLRAQTLLARIESPESLEAELLLGVARAHLMLGNLARLDRLKDALAMTVLSSGEERATLFLMQLAVRNLDAEAAHPLIDSLIASTQQPASLEAAILAHLTLTRALPVLSDAQALLLPESSRGFIARLGSALEIARAGGDLAGNGWEMMPRLLGFQVSLLEALFGWPRALERLRHCLQTEKIAREEIILLADLLVRRERGQAAEGLLAQLGKVQPNEEAVPMLRAQAAILSAAHDPGAIDRAAPLVEALVKGHHGNSDVLLLRAEIARLRHDRIAWCADLDNAAHYNTRENGARLMRIGALIDRGDNSEIEDYRRLAMGNLPVALRQRWTYTPQIAPHLASRLQHCGTALSVAPVHAVAARYAAGQTKAARITLPENERPAVARLQRAHDLLAERIAEERAQSDPQEIPPYLFLVGAPESGLADLLAAYRDVIGLGVTVGNLAHRLADRLPKAVGTPEAFPECLIDADQNALSFIRRVWSAQMLRLGAAHGLLGWVDASMTNTGLIPFIRWVWPHARIVYRPPAGGEGIDLIAAASALAELGGTADISAGAERVAEIAQTAAVADRLIEAHEGLYAVERAPDPAGLVGEPEAIAAFFRCAPEVAERIDALLRERHRMGLSGGAAA